MRTRVTDLLGVDVPIIQAPMGYIARARLAAAVSEAGAMGIIETSSGDLPAIATEIAELRSRTDRPFGLNIAQNLVRDEGIVDFVAEHGVRFVTTSAGDPRRFTEALHERGVTVFHVVPTVRAARKAVAAGVDGLVVEGVEGGGFKNPDGASSMVLVPAVCALVDLPVVAAGGFVDGASMAAAFALGAEGVQMGTRMLASAESPVHTNWKDAVVAAAETDTVIVNRRGKPAMRALRTERTTAMEATGLAPLPPLDELLRMYFGGDMEAGVPFGGQVAGRIDEVRAVADIVHDAWRDCRRLLVELGARAAEDGPDGDDGLRPG